MNRTAQQAMVTLDRDRGIGGSDAQRVMAGDWLNLYAEKIGMKQPDDLSDIFKVQLGLATEQFHLRWFAKRTGFTLVEPEMIYHHREHSFMFAHLDGWIAGIDTHVEAKHSRSGSTAREKAEYYMPQLQHCMAVTGRHACYLSVIPGNDEPDFCLVSANAEYQAKLIELEKSFWWHVTEKVAPELLPTATIQEAAKLSETVLIDGLRRYDMAGNNAWADIAEQFKANKEAAKLFEDAKAEIKKLLPADASECYGAGLSAKRDRANRVTIKVIE